MSASATQGGRNKLDNEYRDVVCLFCRSSSNERIHDDSAHVRRRRRHLQLDQDGPDAAMTSLQGHVTECLDGDDIRACRVSSESTARRRSALGGPDPYVTRWLIPPGMNDRMIPRLSRRRHTPAGSVPVGARQLVSPAGQSVGWYLESPAALPAWIN